jgi:CBS domain-containing protein
MLVKDVMTPDPEVVSPDARLTEAAELMRRLDVGVVPVFRGDEVVGMITDRDITVRASALGVDPDAGYVRDFMTNDVHYVFDDDDVDTASKRMREHQIRRLVVLTRQKKLVGIVALGDLAVDGKDEGIAEKALEEISEPAHPKR